MEDGRRDERGEKSGERSKSATGRSLHLKIGSKLRLKNTSGCGLAVRLWGVVRHELGRYSSRTEF